MTVAEQHVLPIAPRSKAGRDYSLGAINTIRKIMKTTVHETFKRGRANCHEQDRKCGSVNGRKGSSTFNGL